MAAQSPMALRDLAVEFRQLFGGHEFLKSLRERALKRGLRGSNLRSVAWRAFLEVLPPYVAVQEWPSRMAQLRAEYDSLYQKHFVDPREAEQHHEAQAIDPLSQCEDSPWNRYFQNNELQKEIMRDIERTYPEHDFFQLPQHQEVLKRVLFVYAREHPDVQYRQGMHELLAPLYYLIFLEAETASGATGPAPAAGTEEAIVRGVLDPKYVEADSWAAFNAIMVHANDFFAGYNNSGPVMPPKPKKEFSDPLRAESPSLQAAQAPPAQPEETPIVRRCKRIHNVLLRQKDPQLAERLDALDIQPQLYGLRWLKLLFGREFHLQDLMTLWDGIFAFGRGLALVDGIAVSMLVYIRDQLFVMDQVGAMRRLLKYPPVEDVTMLVAKAVEFVTPRPQAAGPVSPTQPPQTTLVSARPDSLPQSAAAVAPASVAKPVSPPPQMLHHPKGLADGLRDLLIGTGDDPRLRQLESDRMLQGRKIASLATEVAKLQDVHTHCAARIERIVFSLQAEVTSGTLVADDTLVRSLAELKQVQAVLNGSIMPDPSQLQD